MILVCGGLADPVTELVCARLEHCAYPYRLLDLGRYPTGFHVKWHWQGSTPSGYVAGVDWRLNLDEVTSVYVRYLGADGRLVPFGATADAASAVYAEYDLGLMALLEDLPCTVVNRLGGGMSNHSKTYQSLLVRRCGLLIPRTLVTNDPIAARRFYEDCHGEIIYKSLSGVRSIVRRVGQEQLARLSLLRHGPCHFQELVLGDDIRVHTVGDQVFATRVQSDVVDYRYAGQEGRAIEMTPAQLPPAINRACLRLARELDLALAGIDLKETADGDYYCFEINPSPGFLFYEQRAAQPISEALANLLHHGSWPHGRKDSMNAMNTI